MAIPIFKAFNFKAVSRGGSLGHLFTPPVETEWADLERELFNRRVMFDKCRMSLDDWADDTKYKSGEQSAILAATDLFVEKAQNHLTARAMYYYRTAYFFVFILVAWFGMTLWFLWQLDPKQYFTELLKVPSWPAFLVWMLRSATMAGIFLAGIYFIVSLIRAFLHEATVLLHRRHALRFGRLFTFIKLTDDDPAVLRERIDRLTVRDLEDAFGWNIQPSSAFKDIDPGKMSTSLQKQLLDMFGKILRIEWRSGQEPEGMVESGKAAKGKAH